MAQITYTIPDEKLAEFQEAFLAIHPVRAAKGEPVPSVNKWIKQWGRLQFKNVYEQGRRMLAERTATIDEGIIGE